jgi:ferredoxin-nitrite reductase
MDEEMYIRNLSIEEAEMLLYAMKGRMMMTPVLMSVSCIGTPTCQLGVNHSQDLCRAIGEAVTGADIDESRLPKMYISGCPNSCSRQPVAPLGFAGRKIKVGDEMVEAFDCYIGGQVGADISVMVEKTGTIPADRIPEMVVKLGEMLTGEDKTYTDALKDGSVKALVQTYCQQ